MSPTFGLLIMLCCTAFFYRLGESEYSSGLLLGGASLALWLAGAFLLGLQALGCLLIQAALFVVCVIWNMVRSPIRK